VRIAIVGTELCAVDGGGGGLEQVLRRWAAALAERHEVIVVSHRLCGHAPTAGTAVVDPFVTVMLEHTTELGTVLRRLAPDVVSLHNRPQWAAQVPAASTTAVTFHNYSQAWKLDEAPHGQAWATARLVAFSAVSKALAGAAADRLGLSPGTVAVTPPSIDPVYLDGRRWDPGPVVLAPNRLLRKKGVLELLDVARQERFGGLTFAFADLISPWARPTLEHEALRAAVSEVRNAELFEPAKAPVALAERYRRCAVVVCPVNEEEGLGLVALEAQACGVPLVTTDLGGLREATFPPNVCVPAGDAGGLADAIALATAGLSTAGLSTGPPPAAPVVGDLMRDRAGARRLVATNYSPEASARVFERWLQAAVAKHASV